MIGFIFRILVLFTLLASMSFSFFIFILGEPSEEVWRFFIDEKLGDLPLVFTIVSAIFTMAFFISLWMSALTKTREISTTRTINKLVDPEFKPLKKRGVSRSMKKAINEAGALIESQRAALQRLSNEKAETNDKIVQERLIEERQRLARELHDSVSQQLFATSMLLSALTEQEDNPQSKRQLEQVEKIVQQTQLEMRALLLHLRPVALRNKTLAEGLNDLIQELQQKVYFHIEYQLEEIDLTKAEEDHLFRIAQEALSNTLRHAKATVVELLLIARDDFAILRIQDNGRGFENQSDKSTSYGLKNIAERAVEIGCLYKIVSVPNEGTIVEVKVPRKKGEQLD
ncbi:sensor histidine kinase [Metasolibacillus meyeri]|uniref:Sensor histidine kinase n=1 Tax=Metasolibacillus meyeri TaxID=1071052 RepID=A0AAW9NV16_9BACL|nr:sensor histidine kinase [Metasolibacillus meyeri]MEC1179229.1 sensor histidine kinase [Metasolibacillus meyeri]